jgi:hypothetical protein
MSSLKVLGEHAPKVLSLLSAERMAVYVKITGDDLDAIRLHDQILCTCATLMPITALIEICLRNATSERLRMLFDTADWLQNPPQPFLWRQQEKDAIRNAKRHGQQAVYAKKNQHQKKQLDRLAYPAGIPLNLSHKDRVKARQAKIIITIGQLIAQLTLKFWKRLLSDDYQATLWDRSLKRIFPEKAVSRAKIAECLEIIYQSRNRIAHHEPLFGPRLDETVDAIDYFSAAFGPKDASGQTILEKMILPHRQKLYIEKENLSLLISGFLIETPTE